MFLDALVFTTNVFGEILVCLTNSVKARVTSNVTSKVMNFVNEERRQRSAKRSEQHNCYVTNGVT